MRHNLPNDLSHVRGTSMHYGMGAMSLRISELNLSFYPHPNIPDGNFRKLAEKSISKVEHLLIAFQKNDSPYVNLQCLIPSAF